MGNVQLLVWWNGVRMFNDAKECCTAMQGKKAKSLMEGGEEFLIGLWPILSPKSVFGENDTDH